VTLSDLNVTGRLYGVYISLFWWVPISGALWYAVTIIWCRERLEQLVKLLTSLSFLDHTVTILSPWPASTRWWFVHSIDYSYVRLMACKVNRTWSVGYDFEGRVSPTQYFKIEFLPYRKQTIWLILNTERIAVHSKNHAKCITYSLCGEKKSFFFAITAGVTYSNHCASKGEVNETKTKSIRYFCVPVCLSICLYQNRF
jgi:hypothetical protein